MAAVKYEELCRDFRWDIPEYFNFGSVVDALSAEPAHVAILCEDQDGNRARLCFADIREQSNRIANMLASLGVRPGEPVIIALPRIALWQTSYVGALKAGAIVVPCNAAIEEREFAYRVNHSGAVAIVASVSDAELIADLRNRCPSLKHYIIAGSPRSGWLGLRDSMAKASPSFIPVETRALDPAICLYASGENDSRAVLQSHAYAWSQRYTAAYWLDARTSELHWSTADCESASGVHGLLFAPWMNGAAMFMYKGALDPKKQLELLSRYPIASLCASPMEYRMLGEHHMTAPRPRILRHCTAVGNALTAETIARFREAFELTIHAGYGQPETSIIAAQIAGTKVKEGSLGRPFPGYDVRILGGDNEEKPTGETGEIAVRISPERPPPIFLEYWKDPERNAAAFRGDYYLTGDLASRDSDGYLWFAGRTRH
jgi:acetyl-CoA synthetase